MERIAFPPASQQERVASRVDRNIARGPVNPTAVVNEESQFARSAPSWFHRLSSNEWRRRLLHMLPGFLPILWIVLPHEVPVSTLWQCSLVVTTIIIGAIACQFGCAFARHGEAHCHCSAISYGVVGVLPVLIFPAQPEIAAASLAVLAFGDGSAALGGMMLGGPKLPWNRQKTWTGLLSFLFGSIPLGTFFFWCDIQPAVSWSTAITCVATAALAGAAIESIPSKINDNLRVGAVATITLVLCEALLIG